MTFQTPSGFTQIDTDSGTATITNTKPNTSIIGDNGITTSASGNTITIIGGPGGITWVEETSTSRSLIAGQGVAGNNAGTITMTLPENPPIGDEFIIYQEGAGLIVIQAQGSDVIRLGTEDSTAGGNIESLNVGDNIHLVSFGSNRFRAINGWGSWSVN